MKRREEKTRKNTLKKGLLWILMAVWSVFAMCGQAMAANSQTDWNLKIEQSNQPEHRVEGEAFTPKGIVTSNYNIQNIFVVVYDSNGKEMVSSLRTNLQVKTYDISKMNLDLTKLPVGTDYTYIVAARDEAGKKNLVKVSFDVMERSALGIENFGYLGTLTKGNGFKIAGTLVSNYEIRTCYAAIYDQDDHVLVEKTVRPNAKSFDLVNMTLSAQHLPAGNYVYRLSARDALGKKALAKEQLVIVEPVDPYTEKMNAFISNDTWKNGAAWAAAKTPTISDYAGAGCCAYAADFAKYVFGNDSARGGIQFSDPDEIRAGDIIYVSGKSHWVVVLGRNGSQLKTAEGNWGGKVVISDTAYTVSNHTFMRDGKKFRTFEAGYHFQ